MRDRLACGIVLGLVVAGCGGAPPPPPRTAEEAPPPAPVHARGDTSVTARVGPAGGSLELANGARFEIPEGALAEETEIDLHLAPAPHWDLATKRPLGPVMEILPDLAAAGGTHFRISCPSEPIPDGWQAEDLGLGFEEDVGSRHLGTATATRWQMLRARQEGNRFVADIPSVGGHRLLFGVAR